MLLTPKPRGSLFGAPSATALQHAAFGTAAKWQTQCDLVLQNETIYLSQLRCLQILQVALHLRLSQLNQGCRLVWHGNRYGQGMTVAVPVWQGRISPVFDVATRLWLLQVERGQVVGRQELSLGAGPPHSLASQLAELGVAVLICGALSRPLEHQLTSARVRVLPRICGEAEEVLRAYLQGTLDDHRFCMPGCCGGHRRRRHRRGRPPLNQS